MILRFLLITYLIIIVACSQAQVRWNEDGSLAPGQDYRLAKAEYPAGNDMQIEGRVRFEQMPNSVIITYQMLGLTPKAKYEFLIHPPNSCHLLENQKVGVLARLRANAHGIAEHTFKTERYTISKDNPLLGSTLIFKSEEGETPEDSPMEGVLCATVAPQIETATDSD